MLHSFPFTAETKMIVQTSIYMSHMFTAATLWSHSWPPTTLIRYNKWHATVHMKPPTHLCRHAATPQNTSSTILNSEHLCHSMSHPI